MALLCEKLTMTYTTPRSVTHALRGVDLQIASDQFAGIVGPSGSGKSSLLYLMSGLKTATSGEVWFDEFHFNTATTTQRLDFRRANFGFVFQQPFLIPYLTILENVLVPIDKPGPGEVDFAMRFMESLGIADLAPKFPNECSGGERVRASIARGLVHRPNYLFVDEPTANLDFATATKVMSVLREQKKHGALIVVTHDLEMLSEADVVFRMRDGTLVDSYRPGRAGS